MLLDPLSQSSKQLVNYSSNKPIEQICDGKLLLYIRRKYNNREYPGKKNEDKFSTSTNNKTPSMDPLNRLRESQKIGGSINLPENIGEIKENEADFYCERLITRAEKNFPNEINKAKRELESKHRYKNDNEKQAYIKFDTLLIAFEKYTEIVGKKHNAILHQAGYKDKEELKAQGELLEIFEKEMNQEYPKIDTILSKIKEYEKETEKNEKKYFKNKNEIKKAEQNSKEFNEYIEKKSKEMNINEMQKSLEKDPQTPEEAEKYFNNLNEIYIFQKDVSEKDKTYGDSISKYQKYVKGAIDTQKRYNIQQYSDILNKYNQDVSAWSKKINFKKYENYISLLQSDWKLTTGLKNINTLNNLIVNSKSKSILIKEFKQIEDAQKSKQAKIDARWNIIKKCNPVLYTKLTAFTGLWNGLVEATIGAGTGLGVMILGIIGGKNETIAQMDRQERWLNFLKIDQSSSQKELVYDPETKTLNFKFDNTVSTVASSVSQMITLIAGGGALAKGATKAFGMGSKVAGRVGLFSNSFITQVGGSYGEAIKGGLNCGEALGYSMLSATIQSGLELISPNEVLLGKGSGITKELIKNACRSGSKESLKMIGKTFTKNVGLEIVEENIQEALQLASGNLINMAANGIFGSELGADWNWKNFYSTAIITTLTTGITTGVSTGVQMYEMSNQDQTKLLEHIKSNNGLYLEVTGMLDKAIEGKVNIPNISIEQLQNLKLSLTGNSNINTPSTNTNIQTDYEIKTSPEIEQISQILGARFHGERRQGRLQSDGTYAPRVEKVTDQTWISNHNGQTEVDIANTPFEDLPSNWKSENLEAAKVAVGLIYDMVKNGEKVTSEMIEKMAEIVHNKRLERNGTEGSFENQRVPYKQLTEEEKAKDRNQLLQAIETVKQGNTDYFDGKSHKIFEGNTGNAESNSKLSDRILNEINEQNKSVKLEELRKTITEQYKQSTGEMLKLSDEQLLSVLDAHEQDGILGELTLGQLRQKVKILEETITDPKVRRFLLEAGFCGSWLFSLKKDSQNYIYQNNIERQITKTNMNPQETLRFNKYLPSVLKKGGLIPNNKIDIGNGTILYTTNKIIGKNSGREYIIGYSFDSNGTMHLRQFYRSKSEGCWRACPGMREDGNLSKGEFITDSSYETTTKVDLSLGNVFDKLQQAYYNDFGPYNKYFSYSPISYIANEYNKDNILQEEMGPQNIYIRKLFPNLIGNDKTGHNRYNATDFYAGKYGHTIESVIKGYNKLIPEGLDYKHMKLNPNKSYSYHHEYLGNVNVQVCTIKRKGIDLDFHFAKAINSPDKVRIENVVSSDAQINSRGLYNKQINAGPLVAKPVDYKEQCPNGRNIDQILPKVSPDYRDIRNLYQGNPIIKKFKQISK